MQPGRGKEEHLPKSLGNQPVVVIGGGIGGLVSALELACAGLEVIVVEKEQNLGGRSCKSTALVMGLILDQQYLPCVGSLMAFLPTQAHNLKMF